MCGEEKAATTKWVLSALGYFLLPVGLFDRSLETDGSHVWSSLLALRWAMPPTLVDGWKKNRDSLGTSASSSLIPRWQMELALLICPRSLCTSCFLCRGPLVPTPHLVTAYSFPGQEGCLTSCLGWQSPLPIPGHPLQGPSFGSQLPVLRAAPPGRSSTRAASLS